MIIGLLPIALASGAGSEWKNGIAWVLIGGLTSSMLLTLVIVPVVFSVVENIKSRIHVLILSFHVKYTKLRKSSHRPKPEII
jgi:HAE1 family hydrophobic/amphiphilic exporter-1